MLKKLKALIFGGPPPDIPTPSQPAESERRAPTPAPAEAGSAVPPNDHSGQAGSASGRGEQQSHDIPNDSERVLSRDEVDATSWIGVDLDGTLSMHTEDIDLERIGAPVPQMVARVKDWIEQGYAVKVVTARASVPEGIPPVEQWLEAHGLPPLEVTCEKDLHMIELWDDRGVQVLANSGQPVGPSQLDPPEEKQGEDAEAENGDHSVEK